MRYDRNIAKGVAIGLIAVCCLSASAQLMGGPDRTPDDVGIDQRLGNQVPMDLTFVNEAGEEVTLASVMNGQSAVLALVYYECPMLCGEIMQGMLDSFNAMDLTIGKDFQVITVSFAPEETHELATLKKKNALASYGRPEGEQGWHFLTGKDESIKPLAESVGFKYKYVESIEQYAHGSAIMVITPEGKVARYFYGISYPERDLKFGLMEAANERIGTLADRVVLLCYQYDPENGVYGLVIIRVLQIAGGATVLVMGTTIGMFLWAERKLRRRREQGKPREAIQV